MDHQPRSPAAAFVRAAGLPIPKTASDVAAPHRRRAGEGA